MNRPDLPYRFPRTTHEAFGDADGACAVTCYRAPRLPRVLLWSILVLAALVALARLLGA